MHIFSNASLVTVYRREV